MLTLKVEARTNPGVALGELRRTGGVPGVVYGAHKESTSIALSAREFEEIFARAGESTIVMLAGLGEDIPTLVHEVDLDPITNRPRHVDFYAVTKGQKVEIKIPLEFINESPAVKEGASLVKVLHEIEIKADPMDLPHHFDVNLEGIVKISDQIRVQDLALPQGVELLTAPEEVIALVQEVVEEKIEEAAPVDLNAIEVEKKGKEEEAPAAEAAQG